MNIRDKNMWYDGMVRGNSSVEWQKLFQKRFETFAGFVEIEETKGFLRMNTPLNTSQGQEMGRILLFRTMEEWVEAFDSTDPDHIKEELIDAINYLWSLPLIHYRLDSIFILNLCDIMAGVTMNNNVIRNRVTQLDIAKVSIDLGRIGDLFRNRSWMNNPQDVYFNGSKELERMISHITAMAFQFFDNWEEFYRFWVSKDNVLQFRLRTKY